MSQHSTADSSDAISIYPCWGSAFKILMAINTSDILLNNGLYATARNNIMPFTIPFKNNINRVWEIKSVTLGKSSGCQNDNRNEIQLPISYVTHGNSPENIKGNWRGDCLVKRFHNIIIVLIKKNLYNSAENQLKVTRPAVVCQTKINCHWPWPSLLWRQTHALIYRFSSCSALLWW